MTVAKAGRQIDPPLTDRERILMTIITQLSATAMLRGTPRNNWSSEHYRSDLGRESFYVHFAPWQKPKAGDLVLAKTGHVSRWKIGFYVEALPDNFGGAVIREIGSDKLCNYSNESFEPIIGLTEIDLYEGQRRQFYVKVLKAFAKGDEYLYRFGGLKFDGDHANVTVREAFGGFGRESVPFDVRVPYRSRISVKTILQALRDGGYGTKSFRPSAEG